MAAKLPGLGKGLGALLGEDFTVDSSSATPVTLPIHQVERCSSQPRQQFDTDKLEELADSIREHGILQPLTVRRLASGYYQIIAGERRWRAAKLAGLTQVPVNVIEADDRKAMELAMIENLQREDLNPLDEANGYRILIEQHDMTQEEAAQRVGKSRSAVTNALRLLSLTPQLQAMLSDESLSAGHARALLPLSPEEQEKTAKLVAAQGLSVRQTEQLVKRIQQGKQEEEKESPKEALVAPVDYVAEAEKELSQRLGRACRISHGKRKGRIEITYYGVDDLNNLLEALGNT